MIEIVEPVREVVEVLEEDQRVVYVVEPTAPQAVPTVLGDLADVSADLPATGQGLVWDGAEWGPATLAGAGAPGGLAEVESRVQALEARPVVDSPDDIGAQPFGDYVTTSTLEDYATTAEVNLGLAGRSELGHTHPAPARVAHTPVTLTDQAVITTNAALGNSFRVTLGGDRVLAAPTNPVDGQRCTWAFTQDATGNRALTLDSGPGGFAFGSDVIALVLTAGAGTTDIMGAEYHAGRDRWLVLATAKGY